MTGWGVNDGDWEPSIVSSVNGEPFVLNTVGRPFFLSRVEG